MDCKEDVLDRASFVKQIIDLTMIVSENRKNCCFAIEGEWGSGKSFVLEKIQECLDKEKQKEVIVFLLFDMTAGNMIIMKNP